MVIGVETVGRIRLGISSCLLGEKVRYDGGHKLDPFLKDTLGRFVEWVPVCPEVECGLPIPREAMRLVGDPANPRLVTSRTGFDHTERMRKWSIGKVKELDKEDLCGFVFKSRSPSSGMKGVKIYTDEGMPYKTGSGIFARAFMHRFPLIPVEDEGRLHDPQLREKFIELIFTYRRWKDFMKTGGSVKDLVAFHTEHKLLLMAHSPKHLSALGKIVAHARSHQGGEALVLYFRTMMEGMRLLATTKKNVNVLQHMMGYFKEQLSKGEKEELLEVIGHYHKGLVPLVVPITLLRHYVRRYDEPYLRRQHYLNPHPAELMLRNHV